MNAARQQAMCVAFANELKAVLPLGVEYAQAYHTQVRKPLEDIEL